MPLDGFEIGEIYSRRAAIHDRFGGQVQGGMSTPAGRPLMFLFTGSAGHTHGYRDEPQEDGLQFLARTEQSLFSENRHQLVSGLIGALEAV